MAKINGTPRKDAHPAGHDCFAPYAKGRSHVAGVLTGENDPIGDEDIVVGAWPVAPQVRVGYQVEAGR